MLNGFFGKKKVSRTVIDDMANKQKRYEALVQAYHSDIYRYAYWLCRDQHIAEDIVQDTFLRAWRALDSLQDEKAAKAWLITILRRENARRFERKQFELVDLETDAMVDNEQEGSEHTMESEWLHRQIDKLPQEYKTPLLLQVVMGLSGDEIADQLGLNKNTVMTRLFRARNQLKEALDSDPKNKQIGRAK